MSQFFISCKESRIESNRSFYGCFYLGPFEPSQSITIANALRRTLLSELYGLGIVSVEIEGATHEYSSIPGVRDSVLDILLNLKEIVLKKTIKNFKPQIGYLRARGPGVVRASHLRLPPFIQCVDPDQYIATLADNGFLNLKFVIQYGNKWLSPKNSSLDVSNQGPDNKEFEEMNQSKNTYNNNSAFNMHLKKRRLILKKLKHISFGTLANKNKSPYINTFAQSTLFLSKYTKKRNVSLAKQPFPPFPAVASLPLSLKGRGKGGRGISVGIPISKKYPAINLKNGLLKKLSKSIENTKDKDIFEQNALNPSKNIPLKPSLPPMVLEDVFKRKMVLNRVRSAKNYNKQTKKYNLDSVGIQTGQALPSLPSQREGREEGLSSSGLNKKMVFFNANPLTIDAVFNPINKVNYIIEMNDFKTAPSKMDVSNETSELYEMLKSTQSKNDFLSADLSTDVVEKDLKNYMQSQLMSDQPLALPSQREGVRSKHSEGGSTSLLNEFPNAIAQGELENILEIKRQINALKKETIKHNITLEVWTNGSIHPRDALYQGFKNLIKLFAKLKKINSFGLNEFSLNSLSGIEKMQESQEKQRNKTLSKKIKMGEINSTLLQDLLPLNETSFLSTYVAPKLKNYYLNNESLSVILKSPFIKRKTESILMENNVLNGLNISESKNSTDKVAPPLLPPSAEKGSFPALPLGSEGKDKADIGILNLSLRSYTGLKRFKINTIEQLLELSKKDLTNLKKLGKASIEEIEKSLHKVGFSLAN